jgi:multidrug transporter EmrE-like cation transporter
MWGLVATIVAVNTVAQGLLKVGASRGLLSPAMIGGVGAYGLSTLLYVTVLSKMKLTLAYPVIIGATVVATCLVSVRFLDERVGAVQWAGIGLVVAGIACIGMARG